MSRPWLTLVWERLFATEDEADEAYDRFSTATTPPLEVDRYDANVIRVYLNKHVLESCAEMVEAEFEPPTIVCYCTCGHQAVAHEGEEFRCRACRECEGFERDRERELKR